MKISVKRTVSLNYDLDQDDVNALNRAYNILLKLNNTGIREDSAIFLDETNEECDLEYFLSVLDAITTYQIHFAS